MSFLAIFKRVAPFFLTFAAGLFVASFFVSIAAPNFGGLRGNSSKYREFKRTRVEIEELKRERCRLKNEIEQLRIERDAVASSVESADVEVLSVPPPVKLKELKMKTVELK